MWLTCNGINEILLYQTETQRWTNEVLGKAIALVKESELLLHRSKHETLKILKAKPEN